MFQTWHDLRSKTKKRHAETNGDVSRSSLILTDAEQEALGIKSASEFTLDDDDVHQENLNDNVSIASLSEPEYLTDEKICLRKSQKSTKLKNNSKHSLKHSNKCYFNCDMIAAQEQRKLELKGDYLNFKKEYLRQKLKLLKEQTESLKTIAKELSK